MNLTPNKSFLKVYNVVIKFQKYKSNTDTTSNYCLESVKKYDYENFMCTLLLKGKARTNAFAIRSFNVEVSRVAEQVTQSTMGLLRMKFWEEMINSCYSKDFNKVPHHPVAIELYKAITDSKLTKRYFENLIKSRTERFIDSSFLDLEAIEQHSEKSLSNVYYLLLEGCGVKNVNADHAASHLGKAQGLVQQLRSTPLTKKLNFIPLPQNLLVKHNITHEELIRCIPSERLCDCSFEIASRAHQHLRKARSLSSTVPHEGQGALLPAVVVDNYLERLQKVDYNIFHADLQSQTFGWLAKLWFANFLKKY
ncbi:hypothetical protein RN001_007934 [Aquatica leii]|uniref:NADH dehydrogenase (Ubiquinone) complex I, assembly factor 6 n=1 Tax=Aquatica leii TaxID=1421715 RepID=A0AAN7PA56_9COLE|nr:hypothetical protein RN001_007934 [Aquatica leii]